MVTKVQVRLPIQSVGRHGHNVLQMSTWDKTIASTITETKALYLKLLTMNYVKDRYLNCRVQEGLVARQYSLSPSQTCL